MQWLCRHCQFAVVQASPLRAGFFCFQLRWRVSCRKIIAGNPIKTIKINNHLFFVVIIFAQVRRRLRYAVREANRIFRYEAAG
ncbi:hypothetical protein [Serratia ficaria]|uniref:hypothetical protein n=1 Tax=Serratia ficaria TaxID=61651 RepID=UPI0011AB391E|nr:hypothetical protein [Serratia ficaria]